MKSEEFPWVVRRLAAGLFTFLLAVVPQHARAAGVLDLLSQFGVTQAPAQSAIAAPKTTAINGYKGSGTGALDLNASHSGVCADAAMTCTGSNCECSVFTGSVKLPILGETAMTLNITTDNSSGFSNGQGECFPGTGHGKFCNASGKSCLGIFVIGSICAGTIAETSPSDGEANFDANETFYIVPATSTGSVNGASGGGNLQIPVDVQIVGGNVTSQSGYAVLNGIFQKKP